MIKGLIRFILLVGFVSCGKQQSLWPTNSEATIQIKPAVSEQYSYEFRGSSCTTNVHKFETFDKACEGLKDDTLNNDCASNKREELFISSSCSGDFS
jgi:hypothetical protein